MHIKARAQKSYPIYDQNGQKSVGVSNGPIQFESARKIWPLLELLAKIR